MKTCPGCGHVNDDANKFCSACGKKLAAPTSAGLIGSMGAKKFTGGVSEPKPPVQVRPKPTPAGGGKPVVRREPVNGGAPRPPRRSRAPLWIALGVFGISLLLLAAVFLPRLFASVKKPDEADLQSVRAVAVSYQNENGTVPPERAQEAIDAVYAAALQNPEVISCKKDEYGVFMEVSDGPAYVYCPPVEGMDAGGSSLEIITLQPYDTENKEINLEYGYTFELDAPDKVARALADSDSRWRFASGSNVNDGTVTMERILSLSDYQVILWQGHGGYTEASGYFLCTDILWSKALAQRYGLNEDNCYRYLSDTTIGLRPAYFEQKFPDGAFDNSFIYLATCFSGKSEIMAQTLLNKGAAVVFVNSESINRGYNLDMMHLIAESYLVGLGGETTQAAIRYLGSGYSYKSPENWTINDSLALARRRYGEKDPNGVLNPARVYYLCRPGMEKTPYDEWVAGFSDHPLSQALKSEREKALFSYAKLLLNGVYFNLDVTGVRPAVASYYCLSDMDGDGIEELIVYSRPDSGWSFAVYSYKNDRLVQIADSVNTCDISYWGNCGMLMEIVNGVLHACADRASATYSASSNNYLYYDGISVTNYRRPDDLPPASVHNQIPLINNNENYGVLIASEQDSLKSTYLPYLSPGEPIRIQNYGVYFASLSSWDSDTMTVDMLNYDGTGLESYLFSSVGQRLTLPLPPDVLVKIESPLGLDGKQIECRSLSKAMNTAWWGDSTTLPDVCSMQIQFFVEDSVVTEIVFLYAP